MARYRKDRRGLFYTVIELERGPANKRQRKWLRAKTAGELKAKIEAFHAGQQAGEAPIRAAGEYTIATLLWEWLDGQRTRGKLRPSTLRRYEMDMRNHLVPEIGYLTPPKALTLDHVQRLTDRLTKAHKAPRTVRNILTPLSGALDAAKRRGLVRENVARSVELPEAKAPDLYQLTPDEMRRFLDAVKGDRFEALYWLSVLGFREAELLGLRWANVDLERGLIRIVEAVQRVKQAEGASKMTAIAPKTKRGIRTVRIPDDWIQMLRSHQARQDQERVVSGWRECDLVFPSTIGTPMEPQNFVNRCFKPALARAGLPSKVRFHDMRHGAASMLIALGYDARTVADILGHSSPDFTLRQYAHSFEEVRDRATADVGSLLRESSERVLEMPPKRAEQERE